MEQFKPKPVDKASQEILKTLSITEADSVLYGLELTEGNMSLADKMLEIEEEMRKRPYLKEDVNSDTGEMKKGGKTEFKGTKEDLKKHIKENLTRPSKYVKGAVISALIAAGLAADFLNYGPISEAVSYITSTAVNQTSFPNVRGTLEITEAGTALFLMGRAIQQGVKSIIQMVKTKNATNKALQRLVAMRAGGIGNGLADELIKMESTARGYNHEGYEGINNYGSFGDGTSLEEVKEMRKTLDDMNIPRFDRAKYVNKKKYI